MAVPRGAQVPFSSGLSGLVLVVAMFSLAAPLHEALLLGAWALVYLIECIARGRFSMAGALRSIGGGLRRLRARVRPSTSRPTAADVGRWLLTAGSFLLLGAF